MASSSRAHLPKHSSNKTFRLWVLSPEGLHETFAQFKIKMFSERFTKKASISIFIFFILFPLSLRCLKILFYLSIQCFALEKHIYIFVFLISILSYIKCATWYYCASYSFKSIICLGDQFNQCKEGFLLFTSA